MELFETAMAYRDKGLSIIPLWSEGTIHSHAPQHFMKELRNAQDKNAQEQEPKPEEIVERELLTGFCKRPFIFKWAEYQERIASEQELRAWFKNNPDLNLGIVTGMVSGVIILDLDSQSAYEYAMGKGLPLTPTVRTGKGWQLYFKHPGIHVKNGRNAKLKIDIRGEGGYGVAPPSTHGNGRKYEWVEGQSILEIEPAECPDWLIEFIKFPEAETSKTNVDSKKKTVADTETDSGPEEKEFAKIIRDGVESGERNQSATSLIGHLFKSGLKESVIWEIFRLWNAERNKPPMGEDELKRTFISIRDKEKKSQIKINDLLDTPQSIENDCNQGCIRIPFAGDNLHSLEAKMNGGFAGGNLYIVGGIPSTGKTALVNNIADNICQNNHPVLFFSYDDGRTELRNRTFSRFSSTSIESLNLRTFKDIKSICSDQAIKKIIGLKYVVQSIIPVEKWTDLIEQIKKKHGKAPVVIIDYLRKVKTGVKTSDERLRVDGIINNLSELAKTYNIPVIAISELARDSYKSGQRLSMASFKESGTIEYEASWLGILGAVEEGDGGYQLKENWEKLIEQDGNIEVMIFKAKRGTGTTGVVHLKVDREKMTVKDRPVSIAAKGDEVRNTKNTKFGRRM